MHARMPGLVAVTLFLCAQCVRGDELIWRAAMPPPANRSPISLGRPKPAQAPDSGTGETTASAGLRTFVRAQAPDPVPPPPPPPPPPPGVGLIGGPNPGEEAFNCGVANTSKAGGGFLSKFCD